MGDKRASGIDVAAGLIFRGGKLLITQRRAGDHLGGLWEFPGGKVESSESFEGCLRRELREELGIEVVAGPLIESITHAYPEKTVHLRFYKCELLACEPQPLACAAVAWITRDELDDYSFPEADKKLLEMLKSRRDLWTTETVAKP